MKISTLSAHICLICAFTHVHAADNVILSNLWINGLDRNTEALVLQQDNQYYVECQILNSLNLKVFLLKKHATQEQYCLVSSDQIHSNFDNASQSLKIDFPAEYFLGYSNQNTMLQPDKASLGAFLNYDFFYDKFDQGYEFNNFYELGIFKDYWLLNNSLIYRKNDADDDSTGVIRLNSSLSIDFPQHFTRLTLGDNTNIYNSLIDSFRFGGISFGTNFSERSDFIYWNTPILRGSAIVPSTIDLYINGVSIYRQNVTPGDYTLQTGANIQQSGNAQIVVEDILGNRSVQNFPVLINNRLLKVGLNEYNVSLGKLRFNYDYDSNDYRDFFTNVYFRRGFSTDTTLGFNGSYSDDVKNLGLMWTQSLGRYALLDVNAAGSSAYGNDGYSVGASVSNSFDSFSMGLSTRYSSEDYQSLGYTQDFRNPRIDSLAYLSFFKVPYVNSVNLNYVERRYYPDDEVPRNNSKLLTVGISKSFSRRLSFTASYFKDFGDFNDSGAFFSLIFNWDDNKNIYLDQTTYGDTRLTFAKSSPEQTGFDYSVGAERRDGEMTYNGFGLFKTDVGDLTLQHTQNSDSYDSRVSYRGALVWLNHQVNLTKSVDSAFALVKVGDYKDVDVMRSLSPVGRTNKNGYFFIHDILPYISYDLSFDQDQLPIEDKIDYSSKKMVALNQRGYYIDFPVIHTQQVIVKLRDKNGNLLARATPVYLDQNTDQVYPVDQQGNVYLYGLLPKTYQLSTQGDKACHSQLQIPEKTSTTTSSQVIELTCK